MCISLLLQIVFLCLGLTDKVLQTLFTTLGSHGGMHVDGLVGMDAHTAAARG